MKVITCTGYYGTGSSAVTDFFSEFSNCSSIGNYEVRFIHEPHGIRNLEYNIIENNHRHNTSHAIKEFIKYTNHLNGSILRKGYKRYMDDSFRKLTEEYVSNISELCCNTWWNYDQVSKGELFNDIDIIYQKIVSKFNKERYVSLLKLFCEKGYYTSISEEDFIEYTKKYIYNVLSNMDKGKTEYIMVDQLLPPTNIQQYLKYFDEIKVVVVDRDPRDCYLLEAEKWKSGVTPYKDVKEFCQWFEIIRRNDTSRDDNKNILHVRFEDMIYNYEEISKKLTDFVGIDEQYHKYVKASFNPEISIYNTNLAARYPQRKEEISYIEQKLPQYLYKFIK